MWIRWGGIVSNHRNLSIFTFISPIALTVCLPWQRLFSDQLCADLASAPFPSTLPTQVAFLPAASQTGLYQQQRGRERTRKRGGWRGRAKDGRRQRTSGKEKFLSQSEENFWRTEMMHRRRTQFTRLYLVSSATHTHKNESKLAIHSTNLWLYDHKRLATEVPEQTRSKINAELASSGKTRRLQL